MYTSPSLNSDDKSIIEKQKDDEAELVLRTIELFKLRRITNIRAALEFIRGRIIYKKAIDPLDIHEPIDNLLEATLNEDADFKECLGKTCKVNNVTTDAVKKCIGGLYHTSSKGLHGYDKIAIRAKDWEVNEIIALGLIFKYYRIPFIYWDEPDREAKFPYELAV
ncbi:410_t:CDS:2 [Funneliformis caledonium]|uniref:410_t:CDS:1 n=1 Tax=Funneliformis caledonium TaxID=1117310 RepID=A0A9N9BUD5_9GLOM|nr:410_t:CDS:2 [Funneliformis caledonium]